MNKPGFTLVQQRGLLTLELYGGSLTGSPRFISYHRSAHGTVVFLGRLFYRKDLLARLGTTLLADQPTAVRQDEIFQNADNDAALVMAAYQRWGRDAFTFLEGDFSVAIYDAREDCLIGARDPLGGYPLYHTSSPESIALGTCLAPLTRLQRGAVISHEGLADYLLLRTFGFQQPDGDASIFEAIGRVRGGQIVRLKPGSSRLERCDYWNWTDAVASADVPERHPDAICEHFGDLLREAVRERCTNVTAAQFSGGMDSTAVALLAAEQLSGRAPVHAVSLVYERLRGLASETPFIREALDACPGLTPHLLPADDIHDFDRFPSPPSTDEPWPGLYRVATETAMYDAAAAAGATSMLTGCGGDEIANLLPFDVADHLRHGHPWAAWQTAAQWAAGQNRNAWNVFGPYGLVPLTPAPLRGGLQTFLRRGRAKWRDLDDCWIPPWVHADFARKYDLYNRALCNFRRGRRLHPSLQVSESLNMLISRNGDMIRWHLGAPRGIHTGNPFLDPRVVRYGLAARSRLPFRPDRQKPLLADAMRGVLPESIRNRRRKGNFSEAYFVGLSRRADDLEAMIQNAPVDDLAFLDKGVLLECFREHRMARAANQRAWGRMTIILAVLNWLSNYREWMRDFPPASQTLRWPAGPESDDTIGMRRRA